MTAPAPETTTPVEPSTPEEPVEDSTAVAPEPELDAADDSLDLPENLDAARKVRNENRALRERSKTAEGERDALRAEVDGWRRQAVESIVAGELRDPRDFHDRHDSADFIGDDGKIDTEAVLTAARALAAERPHYAPERVVTPPPTQRPIESLRPGASPPAEPAARASWHSVLRRGIDAPAGLDD